MKRRRIPEGTKAPTSAWMMPLVLAAGILLVVLTWGDNRDDLLQRARSRVRPPDQPPVTVVSRQRPLLGSLVRITAAAPLEEVAIEAAIGRAFDEIERIQRLFSEYDPESPVSRLNANAGLGPVGLPDEALALLERSVTIHRETGGRFDITFLPVWNLWKKAAEGGHLPAATEIDRARRLTGIDRLAIDRQRGTAALGLPGMGIGFGGIAKGYAVDRACAALEQNGVHDWLVNAGGDMRLAGSRAGAEWTVAVRHPDREWHHFLAVLKPGAGAVVTSGDYERFVEIDGQRHSHIVDTATGRPAGSDARSVTVVAADATTADAFATAVYLMGVEAGLAFLERRDDLEGIIIDRELKLHVTSGLAKKVELREGSLFD